MSALPPLSAVRAFEAAARHGSFTRAATELGMTQAAVSYQVKLLEDRIGAPLFLRLPKRVALSEAGKRLAPPVTEAFQRLEAAFAAMRETSEAVLSISAIMSFAANWLVPRLGAFQLAHPTIAVRLETTHRLVDFAREEFDLGIRTGHGKWPGLKAHLLMPTEFTPLCGPAVLARAGKLNRPADLLKLPLLDWRDDWWRQWFALAGIADPTPAPHPTVQLESQVMLGQAAMSGQGVAIVT
ncbi:MAG: LysR substrate-binding domain-containing protein, partial [Dongiaceae bacterium]